MEKELRDFVHLELLAVMVRALVESHPDPKSLRESVAHIWGIRHRDLLRDLLGHPHSQQVTEEFRLQRQVWESYMPDSEAARSKPK